MFRVGLRLIHSFFLLKVCGKLVFQYVVCCIGNAEWYNAVLLLFFCFMMLLFFVQRPKAKLVTSSLLFCSTSRQKANNIYYRRDVKWHVQTLVILVHCAVFKSQEFSPRQVLIRTWPVQQSVLFLPLSQKNILYLCGDCIGCFDGKTIIVER